MPIAPCDVVENYTQPPWSYDQTSLPEMLFSIHWEWCDVLLSFQRYLWGRWLWEGHNAKKYTVCLCVNPQHYYIMMSFPPCLASCWRLVIIFAFFSACTVFSISMFLPFAPSCLLFLYGNPSTCSLLPVVVFLSVSLLVLRTVTLFFPVIASLLVYRVWTTFQKWNSKTSQAIWWWVLKVL